MKCRYTILLALVALFAGNAKAQRVVEVVNPFPKERTDIVSIPLKSENRTLQPVASAKGVVLPSQLMDEDGDGVPDHVLVEVTVAPSAKMKVKLSWSEESGLRSDTLVAVRLSYRSTTGKPSPALPYAKRARGFVQDISNPVYQMEGPGIENDKVAFRSFFDYRNGKDIYGKVVSEPVLDVVGVVGSWHDLLWWGKDVLQVGKSLGAGTLAVMSDGQITVAGDADTSYFKVCNAGPLAASYLLSFKGWDGGPQKVDGYEMISMQKGQFYYKNQISRPLTDAEKLVVGFANFGDNQVRLQDHGGKYMSLSSYGMQADRSDKPMGLAIMFETEQYDSYRTNGNDAQPENSTYVVLTPQPKERTLYFVACWGATDERFNTKDGFYAYLQELAESLSEPLHVKVIK